MTGFFNELFGGYASGSVEIRLLSPKGKELPTLQKWFGLKPEFLAMAKQYALDHANEYDAYFGVLPRIARGGARDADCFEARWIWADIDGPKEATEEERKRNLAAALRSLKDKISPPRFVVLSGNGAHLYWPLAFPIQIRGEDARKGFGDMAKRLALLVGGDSAVAHVGSPLRVPGAFNHKSDPPKLVRALRPNEAEPITWMWLERNAPFLPGRYADTSTEISDRAEWKGYITEGLQRWMAKPIPIGGRHKYLRGAAKWLLLEVGVPVDAMGAMIMEMGVGCGLSRPEVEDITKWAARSR